MSTINKLKSAYFEFEVPSHWTKASIQRVLFLEFFGSLLYCYGFCVSNSNPFMIGICYFFIYSILKKFTGLLIPVLY